jgi:hypothetical protein
MLVAVAFIPHAKAMFQPELFVSPNETDFYAPCIVSSEFDISVKIFNEEEETGVSIYAFDFYLWWMNSTEIFDQGDIKQAMIDLVSYTIKSPWPEGSYFIIQDELNTTGIYQWFYVYNPVAEEMQWVYTAWNFYHFAITALDTTPGLSEIKAPVVDFTFHIADEPIYDECWWNIFHFTDAHYAYKYYDALIQKDMTVEDGCLAIRSSRPQVWLQTDKAWDEDLDGDTDFWYTVQWTKGATFDVEVRARRMPKLFSFGFRIYFNASLITTDLQHIEIKSFLPPPYETLMQDIYIQPFTNGYYWTQWSYIDIYVKRPCNKPPICGAGPLVDIVFTTKCPTIPDPSTGLPIYILPTSADSYIYICDVCIDSKYYRPSTKEWIEVRPSVLVGAPQLSPLLGGNYPYTYYNWVMYHFLPRKADLDQSGHVDIVDLTAIAKLYGKTAAELTPEDLPYAKAFAGLQLPTTLPVDLLDVVYIAKYFCKAYTPIDPHTELPYDP